MLPGAWNSRRVAGWVAGGWWDYHENDDDMDHEPSFPIWSTSKDDTMKLLRQNMAKTMDAALENMPGNDMRYS